jgi:hypothetical protein
MADYSGVSISPAPISPNTFRPTAASGLPQGSPVYVTSTGTVGLAYGGSAARALCVGLASSQGNGGELVDVQYSGPLTLSEAEWDALTGGGSGGLTLGAPYYLHPTIPGQLTTTAPDTGGQYVAPVGIAQSSTTLHIGISFPTAA